MVSNGIRYLVAVESGRYPIMEESGYGFTESQVGVVGSKRTLVLTNTVSEKPAGYDDLEVITVVCKPVPGNQGEGICNSVMIGNSAIQAEVSLPDDLEDSDFNEGASVDINLDYLDS